LNCRKVSSLLSAYIDRELTGEEMLDIRGHLGTCSVCRAEQESLVQTKRLLSSLALQTPRAELEQLLVVHAERETTPSLLSRVLPPEWTDAMLFRWEGVGNLGSPRLRPLAATAVLSLAGLCLATASVSGPSDEGGASEMTSRAFAVYASPNETLMTVPTAPMISDLSRRPNTSAVQAAMAPVSFSSAPGSTVWEMATPGLSTVSNHPVWGSEELLLPPSGMNRPTGTMYLRPHHVESVVIITPLQP